MNPHPDDFDHLLDRALTSYTEAEPRSGLEQRILHQVAAETSLSQATDRKWARFKWAWLAVAAVSGTLTAILFYPQPRPRTVILSQNPLNQNSPKPAPASPIASLTSMPIRVRHRRSLGRAVPTEPSVALLEPTTQEKLLAKFVSEHRGEALTVAKAQAALDQPIAVRPLDVHPIHVQPIPVQPIQVPAIQLQPISSKPIVIDPIQTASLQPSQLHPASF